MIELYHPQSYTQKVMATLTQVAINTRKAIRYGIYLVIFLIVARMLLGIAGGLKERLFPQPPPPPTHLFGKLKPIPFPKKESPKLEFKVETASGTLPALPTQARVYTILKPASNLLALDTAKQKAAGLGYRSDPESLSQTLYRFKTTDFPSTLDMNIVTGVFSISYDLVTDPTPLDGKPPTAESAIAATKSILSAANLLPKDLGTTATHQFLKVENKKIVPALALSEATFIKVNLWRDPYKATIFVDEKDQVPAVTKDPNESNVWFILGGNASRDKQVMAADYRYFTVDETQFSTYALKTPQEALTELSNGGGFIASLGNNPGGLITIRKIYLAYYDPDVASDYYIPVVVFEGDRGFVGYVPAVTSDYYGE